MFYQKKKKRGFIFLKGMWEREVEKFVDECYVQPCLWFCWEIHEWMLSTTKIWCRLRFFLVIHQNWWSCCCGVQEVVRRSMKVWLAIGVVGGDWGCQLLSLKLTCWSFDVKEEERFGQVNGSLWCWGEERAGKLAKHRVEKKKRQVHADMVSRPRWLNIESRRRNVKCTLT